jgi:hypothetical protein
VLVINTLTAGYKSKRSSSVAMKEGMISGEYRTSAARTRSRSPAEDAESGLEDLDLDERKEEKESNSPLDSRWPQISSRVLIFGWVVSSDGEEEEGVEESSFRYKLVFKAMRVSGLPSVAKTCVACRYLAQRMETRPVPQPSSRMVLSVTRVGWRQRYVLRWRAASHWKMG